MNLNDISSALPWPPALLEHFECRIEPMTILEIMPWISVISAIGGAVAAGSQKGVWWSAIGIGIVVGVAIYLVWVIVMVAMIKLIPQQSLQLKNVAARLCLTILVTATFLFYLMICPIVSYMASAWIIYFCFA